MLTPQVREVLEAARDWFDPEEAGKAKPRPSGMEIGEKIEELLHLDYKTDPQTAIRITVPIDAAHDVVAFSECHCEERVAREGETPDPIDGTVQDPTYRPCLYCACRSSLFLLTNNPMYSDGAKAEPVPDPQLAVLFSALWRDSAESPHFAEWQWKEFRIALARRGIEV
jgi:hypothetical protein